MNIANLMKKIKYYYPNDIDRITKAYYFAKNAHEGQRRVSGEPYIVHPCGVAEILVEMKLDVDTICAAFLHDVIEDTKSNYNDIIKEFGETVGELVQGVTKLDKYNFNSVQEEQAENFRKMFFAIAKDIRVLLIKLADRLHNMRTISVLSEARKIALANETLDIYAPLASRLGMSYIKCELEDISLKVLHPHVFSSLVEEVNLKKEERLFYVNELIDQLKSILKEINIHGEVTGRPKHFYSIYRKMSLQNKSFAQIFDLMAVRVVVDSVADCYAALGRIHTLWKPIPGRFKDYIAMPKPNNYQSLHTTVMTSYGTPFEIQIRTFEMHQIAEYGIAAHWMYKENKTSIEDFDNKINWLRSTISNTGDLNNSQDFLEELKINLYSGQVFVFTPKGDVVVMVDGATPIDFAYNVHSDIGNKCVSAKINGKISPLNIKLQTGDYVEIITSNTSKGPSRDWLKIVKTSGAKSKIRSFFKKSMHDDNIKLGKDMLENEIKHRGYTTQQLLQTKWLEPIMSKLSIISMDDLYASIGYGGVTTGQVLVKLIDNYNKEQLLNKNPKITEGIKPHRITKNGVIIKGYDDLLVKLAKCCTPVPGDAIIGFVSRGRGVVVHRVDCSNMKGLEKERLIEASWAGSASPFIANLQICANDQQGVIAKITALFFENKISLNNLNARVNKQKEVIIELGMVIENLDDLDIIMRKLENIPDIKYTRRMQG